MTPVVVVDDPAFHHEIDSAQRADVFRRIGFHSHDIRILARLNAAKVRLHTIVVPDTVLTQ